MPNKEHLALLKHSVAQWNSWRSGNLFQAADLSRAGFTGANLAGANLSRVNLSGAILYAANLRKADLSGADLTEANLSLAKLTGATLFGAKLIGASLKGADLSGIFLSEAQLREANLSGAKIGDIELSNAELIKRDLRGVDLSGAKLRGAALREADLSGADLSGADLHEADLSGARLVRANLRMASLALACLVDANLDQADLTHAWLWNAQIDGWSIKGVVCEHVFWDRHREEATKCSPGGFERAYAKKPEIRIEFPEGLLPIDMAMLPVLVESLQAENPGSSLRIRSVQEGGDGATVIVGVDDTGENSSLGELKAKLGSAIKRWEQERDLKLEFKAKYDGLLNDVMPRLLEGKMTKNFYGPTVVSGSQKIGSVTYTVNDLEGIGRLVGDLLQDRSEWTGVVADKDTKKFEAALVELKQELAKKEPDRSMIQASVVSLKNMLESAAGTAVYGGLLASLMALAN